MIKEKNIHYDMTKEQFARVMRKKVCGILGGGYKVVIQSVRKNNAVVLTGLSIFRKDCNISPTVYLEEFYEELLEGEEEEELARRIVQCYRDHCPSDDFDVKKFTDYAYVRTHLAYKLINREKNAQLLEEVPHIPYLDMEIVFFCRIESEQFGCGLILIKNEHMKMWGKTIDELMQAAKDNMQTLYPQIVCTMREVFLSAEPDQLTDDILEDSEGAQSRMYVLTNLHKTYGASVILYPGVLEELSGKLDSSLALMPSSVHEMIAMPVEDINEAAGLLRVVRDVNSTQVEAEEILTDSVYYFDRDTREIKVLDGNTARRNIDCGGDTLIQ